MPDACQEHYGAGSPGSFGTYSKSIEKGFLLELQSKDKLYDTAIDHFTKKDQRMDFVYL